MSLLFFLLVTKLLSSALEDLVEVVFGPSDIGIQASKLPDAVDLFVLEFSQSFLQFKRMKCLAREVQMQGQWTRTSGGFSYPVRVTAVCMAFDRNGRPRFICVLLMRHPQLVIANDLIVRNLFPLAGALEVLRHERLVTEDLRIRCHCHEVVGRHSFPDLI